MKGRKPKPPSRQISEGDPRKHGVHKLEARVAAEPKATVGLPYCPQHLKGRARRAWRFWREELEAMDQDRRPDAMMLEGACINYARAVEADGILEREGLIATEFGIDDEGHSFPLRIKKHPAEAISARAWTLVRSFCSEFGLSPVARTRLAIGKEGPQDDDLAAMLSRPRDRKPADTTVH